MSKAPKTYAPRPHQDNALRDIAAWIADGSATRAQVIMACGSGKTLVAAWAAAPFARVVFIAPWLPIVAQAGKRWRDVDMAPTVLVCDASAAKGFPGLPTAGNAGALVRLLDGRDGYRIFTTYQSAHIVGEALRRLGPADLVICDEAHHVAGRAGKKWSDVLYDTEFPAARRLFFTATQRVQKRRKHDPGIIGMDDADMFGEVIHELTFKGAIEFVDPETGEPTPVICDWRLKIVSVPAPGIDSKIEREAAIHQAVRRALGDGSIRNAIVFRHKVKEARESAEMFRRLGVPAEAIDGSQSVKDREERIKRIVEQGGVICTAKAVGEGVDIVAVDAVVFMDSKQSVVDIVQCVGRAVRLDYPGKAATIVVPVVVPEGSDRDLEGTLAHVLTALRQADERTEAAILRAIDADNRRGGMADDTVDFLHVHGLHDALGGTAGGAVLRDAMLGEDHSFEYGFARLLAFVEREGHACPIVGYVDDTVSPPFRLGQWVAMARQLWRDHAERAPRLESLPGWRWSPHRDAWRENYETLRAFRAEHGRHPRADGKSLLPGERKIGLWCHSQRMAYRKHTLPADRVVQLESIPDWNWNPGRGIGLTADVTRTAVADRSRIAALRHLAVLGTEWSPAESVAAALGSHVRVLSQSGAPFMRLRREGLVEQRREWRKTFYRLTPAGQSALAELQATVTSEEES